MIFSNEVEASIRRLIARDTNLLAKAADAPKVTLIKEAFAESPALTLANVTEADFDGYATLDATVGNQQDFTLPGSGDQCVQLQEPVSGWHWEVTGATNLPQTIYGFLVGNQGDTKVYGVELLETPIVLDAIGQAVDIPYIRAQRPTQVWN